MLCSVWAAHLKLMGYFFTLHVNTQPYVHIRNDIRMEIVSPFDECCTKVLKSIFCF